MMPVLKPGGKGGREGEREGGARFCQSTVECKGFDTFFVTRTRMLMQGCGRMLSLAFDTAVVQPCMCVFAQGSPLWQCWNLPQCVCVAVAPC